MTAAAVEVGMESQKCPCQLEEKPASKTSKNMWKHVANGEEWRGNAAYSKQGPHQNHPSEDERSIRS